MTECPRCRSTDIEIFGSCLEAGIGDEVHMRKDARCRSCGKIFDFTSEVDHDPSHYYPAAAVKGDFY
jgi:hypothetical protein